MGGGSAGAGRSTLSPGMNHAATLPTATTVPLKCQITGGDAVSADEVHYTAIKVATVTQQP